MYGIQFCSVEGSNNLPTTSTGLCESFEVGDHWCSPDEIADSLLQSWVRCGRMPVGFVSIAWVQDVAESSPDFSAVLFFFKKKSEGETVFPWADWQLCCFPLMEGLPWLLCAIKSSFKVQQLNFMCPYVLMVILLAKKIRITQVCLP
jgi:hypothetical protein